MTAISVITAPGIKDSWLDYTVRLMSHLSGLNLQLVTASETPIEGPRLYYGVRPEKSGMPFIPRCPGYAPGQMRFVPLDCGESGMQEVLVYSDTLNETGNGIDLLFNLFAYASCLEEWEHERRSGPVHSYALRLKGDGRRFDRPYANYIALALRRLIDQAFPGVCPPASAAGAICLTHDIDVVDKALVTRLKEGVFRLFNAGRSMATGRPSMAVDTLVSAWRLATSREGYFHLETIAALEARHGFVSTFNVFTRQRPGSVSGFLLRAIFDPPYDLARHPRLVAALKRLAARGHEIGIHFAFDAWRDAESMQAERQVAEGILKTGSIVSARQHWFRFSLADTWQAQQQAGIEVDATLGFTDRPGFRAGLASPFHPYDHATGKALDMVAIPTVLMDTHLYYYGNLSVAKRRKTVRHLLGEVGAVDGEACVLWHTHVFSADHGWGEDYEALLGMMGVLNLESRLVREGLGGPEKLPGPPGSCEVQAALGAA
ncbi:MAG: hypothetical protein ISR48_00365 [Alphaproteobacteria bacterium]|nr:hypothetical protein [Alphaproteobacteria bacterium]